MSAIIPQNPCKKMFCFETILCLSLQKAKLISNNPLDDLELPHINQALPKYLSLEQSLELLRNIDSKNQVRDYCIITLFLNCGMRLSELVGLNLSDYSRDNRTLRVLGKV